MEAIGRVNEVQRELDIEWKIRNFYSLTGEDNKNYSSPSFFFAGALWHLRIYPNGHRIYNSVGYVGLFLWRKSPGNPISLDYSFGVKTSDGKKVREKHLTSVFREAGKGYGNAKCLSRSELQERESELISSEGLTVFFTLKCSESTEDASDITTAECSYCQNTLIAEFVSGHEKKCLEKPLKCPDCSEVVLLQNWYDHECHMPRAEDEDSLSGSIKVVRENKVLSDFKELFLKQKDCDVVVRVKEQEFPAHRTVLSARSSVFESTFRNEMKEKTTGIIDIEDCEPSSFSDFLYFLYCGDVKIISTDNVFNLFIAADKYDVQDLRTKCMEFMNRNLSIDTFCDAITLALWHSETELVKLATDFFIKNAEQIIVTAKWQTFVAENPTQSNELFIKALASAKNLRM